MCTTGVSSFFLVAQMYFHSTIMADRLANVDGWQEGFSNIRAPATALVVSRPDSVAICCLTIIVFVCILELETGK